MGTSKTLGNVEPTEAERERMLAVLGGLRERWNALGRDFGPPTFNETDGTAELRWTSGGRSYVTAWIQGGPRRHLLVWRHPGYRYGDDDQFLHYACKAPGEG